MRRSSTACCIEQDIIAPEDKPITVTFRAHLPKGRPSIDVINDVPGPSNNSALGPPRQQAVRQHRRTAASRGR